MSARAARDARQQPLEILFEDDDVVAVAKPAGLASIPGRGEADSLLEQIARQSNLPHAGAIDPRMRVVHRLDKDTSGVMLFAKNAAAQRHLSHQFQNNTVEKEYLAIVVGRPLDNEGEIDAPIGVHPTDKKRMAVLKHGGRPARTMWKVEERFRDFALLRVFPKTGKTHQIRVHLKHAGMPLAVDPLYRPPGKAGAPAGIYLSQFKRGYRAKRDEPERPLIDRLSLHAERLRFTHPGGALRDVISLSPKDFRAALSSLAKYAK